MAVTDPNDPGKLLSLRQVAKRLGLSYSAVKKKYQRGHVPHVRIGGGVYVTERDLASLLRPQVHQDLVRALSVEQPTGVLRFRSRRPRGS